MSRSHGPWGVLAVLAITSIACAGEMVRTPRLAVVADPEAARLADQMTVALSKRQDVVLLDRDEMGRILREQQTQLEGLGFQETLRLGRLMKADGLLVISATADKQLMFARLIAEDPGVILWSWEFPAGVTGEGQTVAIIEKRLGLLLPKLEVSRQAAVPLSVLNLRNAVDGTDASSLERELTELLMDRLAHEPAVFLLERQKLAELGLEKEFLSATTNDFWTGRYLLDGTISRKGSNIVVDARLRSPSGGQPQPFQQSGEAADKKALIDRLVRQVMDAVRKPSSAVDWRPQEEAQQFFEEAQWALQWQLFDQARSASESAWALGDHSDALVSLRIRSYGASASAVIIQHNRPSTHEAVEWSVRNSASALNMHRHRPPTQEALEWSVRSLELYQDTLPDVEGEPAAHAGRNLKQKINDGIDFLSMSSEVLLAAYEKLLEPSPTERETLRELRRLCREIASRLLEETKRHPEMVALHLGGQAVFPEDGAEPNTDSIYFIRTWYGGLWYEDPAQAFEVYRDLLEHRYEFDRDLRVQLSLLIMRNNFYHPFTADWSSHGPDRIEALWDRLINELCASSNSEQQVLGYSFRLAYKTPLVRQPGGPEQIDAAIGQLIQVLWDQRGAIADHQVDEREVAYALHTVTDLLGEAHGYGIKGLHADRVVDLRKKLYPYFLAQQKHYSYWLWATVFAANDYSPGEARQCYQLIETYRKDAPDAEKLAQHQTDLWRRFTPPAADSAETLSADRFRAQRFWPSPTEEIDGVLSNGGRLWVLGHSAHHPVYDGNQVTVSAIDPDTLRTETRELAVPGWWPQDATFDVISNNVFVSASTNIWSLAWEQNDWRKLDLPREVHGKVFAIDNSLYVCPDSAIYRVRSEDNSIELVASARRRPALTPLDDHPPFDVEKIFRTRDGALCVEIAGQWFYRYEEKTGQWTRLWANTDAIFNYHHKFDPLLLLSAIGANRYNPHDESWPSIYLLLRDVRRNGQPSNVPNMWVPNTYLDGASNSWAYGAAVQGNDLWVLFQSNRGYGLCLRYGSASGKRDMVIPLSLEGDTSQSKAIKPWGFAASPLCITPNQLVVSKAEGCWFIPMNELQDYMKQRIAGAGTRGRQSP